MDTTMNHGMCRCCASEGTFKNLSNAYQWMGQEEIYSDMLKECFDISLTTAEPGEEGGICEVCITQLRNAANFKKQVQHTEVQFKKCLQDKLFKSDLIKVEATNLDDGDDSDNDNNLSDNFSGNEFDMAIKKEKEDPKPKKRVATRASTSRAKKSKVDDGEPSTKRIGNSILTVGADQNHTVDLKHGRDVLIKNLRKNEENLKNILLNSNANPISGKTNDGYGCAFCTKMFLNPATLKTHFLEEHRNDKHILQMTRLAQYIFQKYVKIDITLLACALCEKKMETLDDMMMHFNAEHDIKMHTDIHNLILPFKIESNELRCGVCLTKSPNLSRLKIHMSSHFGNYLCQKCGMGFVTVRSLKSHVVRVHENRCYKCDKCDKTFSNTLKRYDHLRRVHRSVENMIKCQYCSQTFVDYYNRDSHLIKEHGKAAVVLKCQACERTFHNQKHLNAHIKNVHLMERNHKCPECDKRFFLKNCLQNHMLKHTGLVQFECDICHKAYKRKFTLREHMRIHANDRRFVCKLCSQAFIQKCSWKSHMRSKHGETV
ncbi:zinc finger protein 37-like isoform X10 [Achroia grisella]|uniref:zinc finger protein 37-like isoform X10 n=1 Tax=Achroia grisella TaxID=688607 RepID=UPI0027D35060|nr:zinc finger protein 37-like isoform X10 [Achroia grisella]